MRAVSTVLTLSFAAGLISAGSAQAVGFGRVANATQLGQRLNFAVLLRLGPDDVVERNCVFADVSAGDNPLQPGLVRVTLEGAADSPDRTVRVTTRSVIDEPVVSISVTVGCTSRTTRRFVAFIDPPGIEMAQSPTPSTDAALAAPQREDSQVAPLVALLAPEPPRRATPRPAGSETDGDAVPTRLIVPPARKPAPTRRLVAAAAKPVPAARLQLDAATLAPVARPAVSPSEKVAAGGAGAAGTTAAAAAGESLPQAADTATTLAAAATASAAAASAASPADGPAERALQRERQRVQSLEEGMARLQTEAAATRQTVVALQARLQQAEASPGSGIGSPLAAAIGALSALLAVSLALRVGRRLPSRSASPWWKVGTANTLIGRHATGAAELALAAPAADSSALATDLASDTAPASVGDSAPMAAAEVPLSPSLTVTSPYWSAVAPAAATGPVAARSTLDLPAPSEPVADESSSVEELIDLEQQAEFFVVLGQDEAAIDLLSHHLQEGGAASPLPYLKLLEIHRRRADRVGYEQIRSQFNREFNAYAPAWEADLQQGRTLEEYPEVIEQLQRAWPMPPQAMQLLDASLFSRGPSSTTFDLPAYRELLSLYSIARDRAQGGDAPGPDADGREVDLLLPLGEVTSSARNLASLNASPADTSDWHFGISEVAAWPVDVDVSKPAEVPVSEALPAWATPQAAAAPTRLRKPAATTSLPPAPTAEYTLETVPAALRRPDGHPDESTFVDLVLEPMDQAVVR